MEIAAARREEPGQCTLAERQECCHQCQHPLFLPRQNEVAEKDQGDRERPGTHRQLLGEMHSYPVAARDWSQEELAFECDLHRTFIAHVERCGRNISLDNLERLAQAFRVPVFELLVPHIEEKT